MSEKEVEMVEEFLEERRDMEEFLSGSIKSIRSPVREIVAC